MYDFIEFTPEREFRGLSISRTLKGRPYITDSLVKEDGLGSAILNLEIGSSLTHMLTIVTTLYEL